MAIELKLGKCILKVNDKNEPESRENITDNKQESIANTLKNIQVEATITETVSQKTKDGNKDIFEFEFEFEFE